MVALGTHLGFSKGPCTAASSLNLGKTSPGMRPKTFTHEAFSMRLLSVFFIFAVAACSKPTATEPTPPADQRKRIALLRLPPLLPRWTKSLLRKPDGRCDGILASLRQVWRSRERSETSGRRNHEPAFGHHHLVIDGASVAKGTMVPMDPKHIHYGKGQTETTVELTPGNTP